MELESPQQILKLKYWSLRRNFTCSQCISHKAGKRKVQRSIRHNWSGAAPLTWNRRRHALPDETHWAHGKQLWQHPRKITGQTGPSEANDEGKLKLRGDLQQKSDLLKNIKVKKPRERLRECSRSRRQKDVTTRCHTWSWTGREKTAAFIEEHY